MGEILVSIKISENKRADDLLGDFGPTCVFVELIRNVLEQVAEVALLRGLSPFLTLEHLFLLVLHH